MTTRFQSAADLMAQVLGMPGYGYATVPHPLSSARDADLREMAALVMTHARRRLL